MANREPGHVIEYFFLVPVRWSVRWSVPVGRWLVGLVVSVSLWAKLVVVVVGAVVESDVGVGQALWM